ENSSSAPPPRALRMFRPSVATAPTLGQKQPFGGPRWCVWLRYCSDAGDWGGSVAVSAERENLTCELLGTAVRDLGRAVAEDDVAPDMILSIARGGLFVAGGLGYALDVKNLHVLTSSPS